MEANENFWKMEEHEMNENEMEENEMVRFNVHRIVDELEANQTAARELRAPFLKHRALWAKDIAHTLEVFLDEATVAAALEARADELGRDPQADKVREVARWFDQSLQAQPWIAGERFTIADITAFCALEFARGLMKFVPGEEGMLALQAWRDRINERPSAKV